MAKVSLQRSPQPVALHLPHLTRSPHALSDERPAQQESAESQIPSTSSLNEQELKQLKQQLDRQDSMPSRLGEWDISSGHSDPDAAATIVKEFGKGSSHAVIGGAMQAQRCQI